MLDISERSRKLAKNNMSFCYSIYQINRALKRTCDETYSPKVDFGTCVSNTYQCISLCNIIKVYFIKLRKEWAIRVAVKPFTEIALA